MLIYSCNYVQHGVRGVGGLVLYCTTPYKNLHKIIVSSCFITNKFLFYKLRSLPPTHHIGLNAF